MLTLPPSDLGALGSHEGLVAAWAWPLWAEHAF